MIFMTVGQEVSYLEFCTKVPRSCSEKWNEKNIQTVDPSVGGTPG